VELLVVVIIIGILAAVAVPIYLNQRRSAWRASVESDVKNVSLAIETVSAQSNGTIPISIGNGGKTYDEGKSKLNGTDTEITVSKDNHIIITVSGNTYTVIGFNENLNGGSKMYESAKPHTTYDSEKGTLSTIR
jgi:type IV pilus assembly protein PilA